MDLARVKEKFTLPAIISEKISQVLKSVASSVTQSDKVSSQDPIRSSVLLKRWRLLRKVKDLSSNLP